MRAIDRWLGIPLTALASLPFWVARRFGKRERPDCRRTLFIELSEMGSAILADPAMRKLEGEADARLYFVIFEKNAKSLDLLATVPRERIFTLRSDSLVHLAVDTLRFTLWCRRKGITCVIDLELFSRFTALLSALSLAGSRIGFASLHDEGLYRGSILNFGVRYNPHVHIATNFVALVNTALGHHDQPYPTRAIEASELKLAQAEVSEAARQEAREKVRSLYPAWNGERLLLFNVNASDMLPQRRWLPENFAAVAHRLFQQFDDILVLLTGADGEQAYVQDVADRIGHARCVNVAGRYRFEELLPLYSISTLMLTNDSGPAHFASVTPLKVFVIFGPETPRLYGPLGNAETFYLGLPCSPCVSAANHRKTTCTTRPCITGISPSWVAGTLASWLAATP